MHRSSTAAPEPALRVEGLGHGYGSRRALDGVSFEVPAGTFTVLLDLNGAGKSTLFFPHICVAGRATVAASMVTPSEP